MDFQIYQQLNKVVDQVMYLKVIPELPDFTIHMPGTVVVASQKGQVEIPFTRSNIREIVSLLVVSVFTGEKAVITWNFKNFISYVCFHTKKQYEYPCNLLDLKLIEGFLGNRIQAPLDFAEAKKRVFEALKDRCWEKVYKTINLPLMTRVVPTMECEGIVDLTNHRISYAHYEIDRSATGRMICQIPNKGYNPHTIGENENYKARGEDEMILYFDYRSMEIRIIQWLSGDKVLGEIIDSCGDMYNVVWEKLGVNSSAPDKWKSTFLAMFYGLGSEVMAEKHNWTVDIAKEIIRRTHKAFPQAFDYILDVQDKAKRDITRDYFGRPRDLRSEPYKARNHVIQSASNVVCMEKLIQLHDLLPSPARLAYSVHDGYALFCDIKAVRDVVKGVLSILESPTDLCLGLRLSASAKIGRRLNKMLVVPGEWR